MQSNMDRTKLRLLDLQQRVDFMNAMHNAVKHRCSVNKVGSALVSDFDKFTASDEEIAEALKKVKNFHFES